MALSPALSACAQVKRGASAKVIAAQLLKAIEGEYSAKSYKERDGKNR